MAARADPQRYIVTLPKVLVIPLCGPERRDWISPPLAMHLIGMTHDPRFEVRVEFFGARPIAHARNCCIAMARAQAADWLLMADSDMAPHRNSLDILARATPGMDIIGLSGGVTTDTQGVQLATVFKTPGPGHNPDFPEVTCVGAGLLMIRAAVWQKIPGPWFKWTTKEDELGSNDLGEDAYFCKLARAAGFKIHTYCETIGHLKTVDLTPLVATAQPCAEEKSC
jgi:hypothetical protein